MTIYKEPKSPIRVGLVDDHDLFRAGLESILASQPEVVVLWSGSSLDEFVASDVQIDVLLLDLDLGGTHASAATVSEIVAAGTCVLAVSALGSAPAVRAVIAAGAAGLVSKGDASDSLISAIVTVAAGSEWITPELIKILAANEGRPAPELTKQEQRVLELYGTGMKVNTVARVMTLAPATVHFHIKKIRAKLAAAGMPAPGQIDLHKRAVELGYLPDDR